MNLKRKLCGLALALGLILGAASAQAQHGHLNAGAVGTSQNDQLTFANGSIFAASSGYVKDLVLTNGGRFAGYYEGGITPVALPATVANGGPTAFNPALGSFLEMAVVSVSGPAGGAFGFWEGGSASPTFSVPVGTTGADFRFDLSDAANGAGQPGADPFGHLHGRRFTATLPGDYTVGFRVFDTSDNGIGGGPIHTPSGILEINFSAIPEPSTLALAGVAGLAAAGWAWQRRRSAK